MTAAVFLSSFCVPFVIITSMPIELVSSPLRPQQLLVCESSIEIRAFDDVAYPQLSPCVLLTTRIESSSALVSNRTSMVGWVRLAECSDDHEGLRAALCLYAFRVVRVQSGYRPTSLCRFRSLHPTTQ